MLLAVWIACGLAVLALLTWRMRVAGARLRTILADEIGATETGSDADTEAEQAEPIAWPHPPRRLWVR